MSTEKITINRSDVRDEFRNIPIYKLNIMMKTASKITDDLAKVPQFLMTYQDAEIILDIVKSAISRTRGGQDGIQFNRSETK